MADITNEELYAEKKDTIPYYVHEGIMARMERHTRRLWVLCITIFVAFVGTNIGWVIYENSFQDVVLTENSQDGEGVNLISGGDLTYGAEIENSKN